MQIKASTDYGLRAVLYLAKKGTMCSSKDISEEMAIPRDYFIQLAQPLRNAGIIDAKPGKHGGYFLAKDPSQITLLQIIDAIESTSKDSAKLQRDDRREAPIVADLQQVYDLVLDSFDAYLDSITVDMMLACFDDIDGAQAYLAERLIQEGERLEELAEVDQREQQKLSA